MDKVYKIQFEYGRMRGRNSGDLAGFEGYPYDPVSVHAASDGERDGYAMGYFEGYGAARVENSAV